VQSRGRHVPRQQTAENPGCFAQKGLHVLLGDRVRLVRHIEKLAHEFDAALMQFGHQGPFLFSLGASMAAWLAEAVALVEVTCVSPLAGGVIDTSTISFTPLGPLRFW
jgi:hypothetical protein